jgi:hypothetical protein
VRGQVHVPAALPPRKETPIYTVQEADLHVYLIIIVNIVGGGVDVANNYTPSSSPMFFFLRSFIV